MGVRKRAAAGFADRILRYTCLSFELNRINRFAVGVCSVELSIWNIWGNGIDRPQTF